MQAGSNLIIMFQIKSVSNTQVGLIEKIEQIQGVQTRKVSGRVYPIGEAAAHLIGWLDWQKLQLKN